MGARRKYRPAWQSPFLISMETDDRDVLLMLHLMEPHLPYEEPWTYRWRFAGRRPASLRSLTRHWLYELPEAGDWAPYSAHGSGSTTVR